MKNRITKGNVNLYMINTRRRLLIGLLNVRDVDGFCDDFFDWKCFLDGDLGGYGDVRAAYMKQKHRMIWERRHGPVGTGMKENS